MVNKTLLLWSGRALIRIIAFLLISFTHQSSAAIHLKSIQSGELLGSQLQYLIVETNAGAFESLPDLSDSRWFNDSSDVISLGYTKKTLWVNLDIINDTLEKEWFLEVAYPVLDEVDFYLQHEGYSEQIKLGDHETFDVRPVNHRNFVVPISLNHNGVVSIKIRVSTGTSFQVPVRMWQRDDFNDNEQGTLIWQGSYFGFLIVFVFYNLCLFYYTREKQFIAFALVCITFALFQACLSGFAYQFLWPNSSYWNELSLPVFLGLLLFTESILVRALLDLNINFPRIHYLLGLTATASALCIFLTPVLSYSLSILTLIFIALPLNVVSLILGIKLWSRGSATARQFTIAFFGGLIGSLILALSKLGFIDRNTVTENALQIGFAVSVIWLSFALGEYIAQQNKDRQKSKEQALGYALELAKERQGKLEAQEATLLVERRANETLEAQVDERTKSLEKAMSELEQAHLKLQHISNTDELSGIYNRRFLNQKLETEFKRAQRTGSSISVLLVDIDHFKAVNDTHGHLVGDECIKSIANSIKCSITRPEDTLARFGGEEFIVILYGTPVEGSIHVAERILESIETSTVEIDDLKIDLTVSVGLAVIHPSQSDNCDDLIAKADTALYDAKSDGRNCIRLYSPNS